MTARAAATAQRSGERSRREQRGATLAAMMATVAVMSILLTVAAQQWSFMLRRELEQELIFRGERIKVALWEYPSRHGAGAPTKLEDLTKQPRPLLPRVYPEPMTARYDRDGKLVPGTGEWRPVLIVGPRPGQVPNRGGPNLQGIRGVHSASEEESIGSYGDVPSGAPYTEWRFEGPQQAGTGNVTALRLPDLMYPPGFGGLRIPGGPPVAAPPPAGTPLPGTTPPPTGGQRGGRSGQRGRR